MSVRMPPELAEEIERTAIADDGSKSSIIRIGTRRYLIAPRGA
jgi:hypothetical protein